MPIDLKSDDEPWRGKCCVKVTLSTGAGGSGDGDSAAVGYDSWPQMSVIWSKDGLQRAVGAAGVQCVVK